MCIYNTSPEPVGILLNISHISTPSTAGHYSLPDPKQESHLQTLLLFPCYRFIMYFSAILPFALLCAQVVVADPPKSSNNNNNNNKLPEKQFQYSGRYSGTRGGTPEDRMPKNYAPDSEDVANKLDPNLVKQKAYNVWRPQANILCISFIFSLADYYVEMRRRLRRPSLAFYMFSLS